MDIKQYNDDKAANWEYLPDTDTLLEYLDRKDLIELSQSCKRYRNQLERRVLESLALITSNSDGCHFNIDLILSRNLEEPLEFLKIDLGSKLEFVNKFSLGCQIDYMFVKIFIKLLPNIKTLFIYGCGQCICSCVYSDCDLSGCLEDILEGMKRLEHLYICTIYSKFDGEFDEISKSQIFPKSIKSLKIGRMCASSYNDDDLFIYDTIDTSYINLHSLTIVTNRMLQNLSSGMPNLREVEISYDWSSDASDLVAFLKANPQLKKLSVDGSDYNKEIFKIILSYQYLEHWSIYNGWWEGIEVNSLSPNYSIKYLRIESSFPAPINLHLINACKNLNTLETQICRNSNNLDWLKFERRIGKLRLKLRYVSDISDIIKKIATSRKFNSIYIELNRYADDDINEFINFKLSNYILVPITSKSCTLKSINKTE